MLTINTDRIRKLLAESAGVIDVTISDALVAGLTFPNPSIEVYGTISRAEPDRTHVIERLQKLRQHAIDSGETLVGVDALQRDRTVTT